MNSSIIIIGAGGHGSEVACYVRELESQERLSLLGFVDDQREAGPYAGTEVLGPLSVLAEERFAEAGYITAVGSNAIRRDLINRIERIAPRLVPGVVCSPSAWFGRDIQIGEGTCVAAGVVITTRVRIGRHCIVNMRASIAHDCVVGDFVNINPAATLCGNVHIGDGAFIGAGAVVKEKIFIGENAVIGAGAVVVRDVPANVTVVGVPARVIKGQQA